MAPEKCQVSKPKANRAMAVQVVENSFELIALNFELRSLRD